LFDPRLHLRLYWKLAHEFFLLVHSNQLWGQIFGFALCQLGHSIYSGSFQEIGILRTDPFYPEQIDMIDLF
jgi:hypothetical protein